MKPLMNFFLFLVTILLPVISLVSCINSNVVETAIIRLEETAVTPEKETAISHSEKTATTPSEETAITPGEEFSLALGKKTSIPSEDLTLQFLGVLVDDRCPTQVECEYTGQAIVEIEVGKANRDSVLLEFNTNPMPDINLQSIAEFGYMFELVRLDPYPEHIANPIRAEDYRAVMVVRSE